MTDATATAPTPQPMGVRDVLRIPSYRNLFAGQAISDIGDGITLLLLLLVINELTGSTAALALMAIAEAVPTSPWAWWPACTSTDGTGAR